MKPDTYREHLTDLQVEVEELRAKLKESQTGDTISRQAAIDRINGTGYVDQIKENMVFIMMQLPSVQPEPKWIPVTTRPMTDEERVYYEGYYGHLCENEAVMFDCPMPDDEQEIWVCSDCGNVWQDACIVDIGIGLEGNGDWLDIVAWMPYEKPQPYSERKENR